MRPEKGKRSLGSRGRERQRISKLDKTSSDRLPRTESKFKKYCSFVRGWRTQRFLTYPRDYFPHLRNSKVCMYMRIGTKSATIDKFFIIGPLLCSAALLGPGTSTQRACIVSLEHV